MIFFTLNYITTEIYFNRFTTVCIIIPFKLLIICNRSSFEQNYFQNRVEKKNVRRYRLVVFSFVSSKHLSIYFVNCSCFFMQHFRVYATANGVSRIWRNRGGGQFLSQGKKEFVQPHAIRWHSATSRDPLLVFFVRILSVGWGGGPRLQFWLNHRQPQPTM